MAKIKTKKKKNKGGSFFMSVVDAFTSFIYSMFANGRMGTWFSSDKSEKESFFMRLAKKAPRMFRRNTVSENIDTVMKNSFFMKIPEAIRLFLSELSLNVYGMFTVMYGATAIVMYFIAFLVNGSYSGNESALITAAVIVICSFPLLVSVKSLSNAVADSKIMKSLVLNFFAIPEEKLKPTKRRTGVVYMFLPLRSVLHWELQHISCIRHTSS